MCFVLLEIFPWFFFACFFICFFVVVVSCLNVSVDCDGCEGFTHPWEGREALGEGHKLGLTLQLRKELLSHDEGLLLSWSMGSIMAMNLVVLGGTRRYDG